MSHLALLKRGNGKSKKRRSSTCARDKVNSPAPIPLPIHRFGAVATPNRAVLSGGGGTLPQPGTLQYLCQFCRAPVPPPTPSQLLLSSKSSVVFCHLCLSSLFSLFPALHLTHTPLLALRANLDGTEKKKRKKGRPGVASSPRWAPSRKQNILQHESTSTRNFAPSSHNLPSSPPQRTYGSLN